MTTTYLINRMSSRGLYFITPLQKFQEFFPHSRLGAHLPLRVFGSIMFVYAHAPKWNKLDPRVFKCYDLISQKLYVSLDATFFEPTPYYLLRGSP